LAGTDGANIRLIFIPTKLFQGKMHLEVTFLTKIKENLSQYSKFWSFSFFIKNKMITLAPS